MSTTFECYVTVNGKKHTIVVNKDITGVTLDDVYQQMHKIDDTITRESYIFEIMDIDFNFSRLTDYRTKIKCLSRLRVSKNPDFKSNSLDNEKSPTEEHHLSGNYSEAKRLKYEDNVSPYLLPNLKNPLFGPTLPEEANKPVVSKFRPIGSEVPISNGDKKPVKKQKMTRPDTSSDTFESNGLTTKGAQTFCQFCLKFFVSMAEGVRHVSSLEHMKNSREESYDSLDQQFLTAIKDKTDLKTILWRKIELNKFREPEKRKLIKHGIRVKDGFGAQSYVCRKCDQYFDGFTQVMNHFQHYLDRKESQSEDKECDKQKTKKKKRDESDEKEHPIEKKLKDFKLPEEVAKDVNQLVRQGFLVVPLSKHKFTLKCRFCDIFVKSVQKAEQHIESEDHKKWLTENPFKGIDRLIVSESAANDDINGVLARMDALRELSYTLKEEFLSHGLKVKDGIGPMTYVCTKCNALFRRLKDVKKHLKEFEKLKNSLLNRSSNTDEDKCLTDSQMEELERQMRNNDESIELLLRNEGIKYKKHNKSLRKQLSSADDDIPEIYFYCVFCNTNFYSKETALYHSNRVFHKKIRRGEYMTPIEAMFCVKSDRIDEFDVAFARMEALYQLDNKTKIELRDKGIRLKDGIGSDAYVCLKCNVSIDCQTIDSALFSLIRHTKSSHHLKYTSHR